jgi:hypothetical protein
LNARVCVRARAPLACTAAPHHQLRRELLAATASMSPGALAALLTRSFCYLPVEELRPVPIAALEALHNHKEGGGIPRRFLLALGSRLDLLPSVPLQLRRQVWAVNSGAFEAELHRLLEGYANSPSIVRVLRGQGPLACSKPPPKRRQANIDLVTLADTVGPDSVSASITIYNFIVQAIGKRWEQAVSERQWTQCMAWCALRSELPLLQAEQGNHRVAKSDGCLKIAQCVPLDLFDCAYTEAVHVAFCRFLDNCENERSAEEIRKRIHELQPLLPWLSQRGHAHAATARASDKAAEAASHMLLGSPYTLQTLLRTLLHAVRTAFERGAAVQIDATVRLLVSALSTAIPEGDDRHPAATAEKRDAAVLEGLDVLGKLMANDRYYFACDFAARTHLTTASRCTWCPFVAQDCSGAKKGKQTLLKKPGNNDSSGAQAHTLPCVHCPP